MFDDYMTENLTVRDALSHRTGMSRNDLSWLNNPDKTIKEMVYALRYLPPAFPFRYRMHYQNHMFTLATLLVETVSGMSWEKFLKTRIFDKLGMKNTYALGNLLDDNTEKKARPYVLSDGKAQKIPYRYLDNVGCTGSVYSTTEDLLKWAKFHLKGDENLLKNDYMDQLHRPHTVIKPGDFSIVSYTPEVDFESYAMGWFTESYRGHKLVHHGGTIDGFKSIVGFVPRHDIAFSVLTNLNRNQSPTALSYMIADLFLGLEPLDWCSKVLHQYDLLATEEKAKYAKFQKLAVENKRDCDNLSDYEGMFSSPAFGDISFKVNNGALELGLIGKAFNLACIGENEFIPVSDTLPEFADLYRPISFVRGSSGKVTSAFLVMDDKNTKPFEFVRK
jgi:CubicO group peptidase (beta-lactamase class C family)